MSFWNLPASFRFSVQDTPDPHSVKVFRGQLPGDGRKVEVAPFTAENLDKVAALFEELRFRQEPAVKYITNHFLDIHRSGGKSHVVGQILSRSETPGQVFDLCKAAEETQANRMGNCDRVNALGYRRLLAQGITDPVLYYWTTQGNHNTVLVGDPRMPKYGERNTVVADAYAVFPMPHTLDQAAYAVHIPLPGEEGYEDLEVSRIRGLDAARPALPVLPEPVSDRRQRRWLKENDWPPSFGEDVVRQWYKEECRETGQAPDRWQHLFSCAEPSARYAAAGGPAQSYNHLPLGYVKRRTLAFLQLHGAYPEASSCANPRAEDADLPGDGASGGGLRREYAQIDTAAGIALDHVTPFDTRVSDAVTGEHLMAMTTPRIQGPAPAVNQSFPIKNLDAPHEVHPLYAWDVDRVVCDPNIKVVKVELPAETQCIMREYFPEAARNPGFFADRIEEIRKEYEEPIYRRPPPSSKRWLPVRLTREQCHSAAEADALNGEFGVIAADYNNQNVGGMGPAFAGALITTTAEARRYISYVSNKLGDDHAAGKKLFKDYAIRVRNSRSDLSGFRNVAPWAGGNVTQYMNGKLSPDDKAHFIVVEVIIHLVDKDGNERREVMPHLLQMTEVQRGKQAILDYGPGYFEDRPQLGMKNLAQAPVVKDEPSDADIAMSDASAQIPLTQPGGHTQVADNSDRRKRGLSAEGAVPADKRSRLHSPAGSPSPEATPWPQDVPCRVRTDGLYVEDQLAMSERYGTYNTCPSHAINHAFQGRAVGRNIQGATLKEMRRALEEMFGIRMVEMSATLIPDAPGNGAEEFDMALRDIAARLEAGGTAIVERGGQTWTSGVAQHFVTLVRRASDGRVCLLDSLAPAGETSYADALEALQHLVNRVGTGAGEITVLVPPENTVLPPAASNPHGAYLFHLGFVPLADLQEAHLQAVAQAHGPAARARLESAMPQHGPAGSVATATGLPDPTTSAQAAPADGIAVAADITGAAGQPLFIAGDWIGEQISTLGSHGKTLAQAMYERLQGNSPALPGAPGQNAGETTFDFNACIVAGRPMLFRATCRHAGRSEITHIVIGTRTGQRMTVLEKPAGTQQTAAPQRGAAGALPASSRPAKNARAPAETMKLTEELNQTGLTPDAIAKLLAKATDDVIALLVQGCAKTLLAHPFTSLDVLQMALEGGANVLAALTQEKLLQLQEAGLNGGDIMKMAAHPSGAGVLALTAADRLAQLNAQHRSSGGVVTALLGEVHVRNLEHLGFDQKERAKLLKKMRLPLLNALAPHNVGKLRQTLETAYGEPLRKTDFLTLFNNSGGAQLVNALLAIDPDELKQTLEAICGAPLNKADFLTLFGNTGATQLLNALLAIDPDELRRTLAAICGDSLGKADFLMLFGKDGSTQLLNALTLADAGKLTQTLKTICGEPLGKTDFVTLFGNNGATQLFNALMAADPGTIRQTLAAICGAPLDKADFLTLFSNHGAAQLLNALMVADAGKFTQTLKTICGASFGKADFLTLFGNNGATQLLNALLAVDLDTLRQTLEAICSESLDKADFLMLFGNSGATQLLNALKDIDPDELKQTLAAICGAPLNKADFLTLFGNAGSTQLLNALMAIDPAELRQTLAAICGDSIGKADFLMLFGNSGATQLLNALMAANPGTIRQTLETICGAPLGKADFLTLFANHGATQLLNALMSADRGKLRQTLETICGGPLGKADFLTLFGNNGATQLLNALRTANSAKLRQALETIYSTAPGKADFLALFGNNGAAQLLNALMDADPGTLREKVQERNIVNVLQLAREGATGRFKAWLKGSDPAPASSSGASSSRALTKRRRPR